MGPQLSIEAVFPKSASARKKLHAGGAPPEGTDATRFETAEQPNFGCMRRRRGMGSPQLLRQRGGGWTVSSLWEGYAASDAARCPIAVHESTWHLRTPSPTTYRSEPVSYGLVRCVLAAGATARRCNEAMKPLFLCA